MDIRKNNKSSSYLISDQPGMKILMAGFFISFLIGYTFKSYFSHNRIQNLVNKALSSIHEDVFIDFENAQLSLNDGIFPRFAIVVDGLQVQSENACLASPQILVDQVVFPLSILSLVRSEIPVHKVFANEMKVFFRGNFKDCSLNNPSREKESTVKSIVTLKSADLTTQKAGFVEEVHIQHLQFSFAENPEYDSELLKIHFQLKSSEPQVIEVRAQTNFFKDKNIGDYLTHANLFAQFSDSPQPTLKTNFYGNWREGRYSVVANYNIEDRLLSVETDVKHIPLSQIVALLRKYKFTNQDINIRQAWLSTKAHIVAPLEKLKESPFEIRDVQLEGDLGQLRIDQIGVKSMQPFVYSPIQVDINSLDLNKLWVLIKNNKMPSIFSDFGYFSGKAQIESHNSMNLSGDFNGLQFVFSSRGQREIQKIDHMMGDLNIQPSSWGLHISRVFPQAGSFNGNIKLGGDRDLKVLQLKAKVDELALSPPVQKLMTNGGALGVFSLDLGAKIKDLQLSELKGLLRLENVTVDGLSIEKIKSTLDWSAESYVLNSQINSLQISKDSAAGEVFNQIAPKNWWNEDVLVLNSTVGVLNFKPGHVLSWKNVQAQIGKSGKLFTEGAWDKEGELSGFALSKDGKIQKKWIMSGTRLDPEFNAEPENYRAQRKQ